MNFGGMTFHEELSKKVMGDHNKGEPMIEHEEEFMGEIRLDELEGVKLPRGSHLINLI